jgi:hypothetical protein
LPPARLGAIALGLFVDPVTLLAIAIILAETLLEEIASLSHVWHEKCLLLSRRPQLIADGGRSVAVIS